MRKAALPLLLSVATVVAMTGAGMAPASASTIATQKSSYWAGYVGVSPANSRNDYFKYVTATFTVPAITSCNLSSDVSQYAGLGGYWQPGTYALQAAGVYETCNTASVQPAYYAAYWDVPVNGATDDQPGQVNGPAELFTVSPGDVIFASVYFDGPQPGASCGGMNCQEFDTWKVTDETTGQTFKRKMPCLTEDVGNGVASCDTNTAEVISQGDVNGETSGGGTPRFGSIHFSQIKVTDYKQTGARAMTNSQWTTHRVVEYGTVTLQPDVTPGGLTTTASPLESAFTNTWHRLN